MDEIEIPPINKDGDIGSPRSQSGIESSDRLDSALDKNSAFAPKEMHSKEFVEMVAESLPVTIIMSIFTIWALFSDDIRLSATEKDADEGFMVVISIAFFLFFAEMCAGCYYKKNYLNLPSFKSVPDETFTDKITRLTNFGSFYFWLDIIATVSLIFEIHWIIGDAVSGSDQTSLKSARAGRASRAGARAGRIVRLVRMVKLYKYFKAQKANEGQSGSGAKGEKGTGEETTGTSNLSELAPESHVGAAMSDLTTRRVIVLVLVMLIAIPLMSYSTTDYSPQYGAQLVHSYALKNVSVSTGEYSAGYSMAIENVRSNLKCLYLRVDDEVFIDDPSLDSFRLAEELTLSYRTLTPSAAGGHVYVETFSIFDTKNSSIKTAQYGIYMTIFILFLLVVGTYFFSTDVNRLVIIPIEKMVALVQEISKNPLGVKYKMLGEEDGFLDGMETTLLLQTINKIGGLMRVGFGEAGASVIAKNLGESSDNKLNLMGSGSLIHSIFGFCDVRNFTDTTECLQEEVMLFVNRIAHILHGIVVQCSGSANKNIGDAFLLTWKIDENLQPSEVSLLADQALLAFCKSLIELCRYQDFICNFSIAANNRLYKRFPGYKVRIGSGLHVGWAIEGAIGSNMKIDASYLSPHVNMAEYLESSTKAYGVPLLMSEAFFRLLTPAANKYCRQVDRLKRSDAEEPFGLFTYDSDLNYEFEADGKLNRRKSLNNSNTAAKKSLSNTKVVSGGKAKNDRDAENQDDEESVSGDSKPNIVVPKYTTDVWESDADIVRLRHLVNDAFRTVWKEGMAAYIKGDWQKARDIFHETMRSSNGQDGPSKFLVKVIDEHGGTAPHDWQGYRQEF